MIKREEFDKAVGHLRNNKIARAYADQQDAIIDRMAHWINVNADGCIDKDWCNIDIYAKCVKEKEFMDEVCVACIKCFFAEE